MVKKTNSFTAALGSRHSVAALVYFCERPSNEAYAKQMEKELGFSHGTALSVMGALEKARFLESRRIGKQVYYRLRAGDPEVKAFKVFLNIERLRPVISALSAVAKKIILFGSAASGANSEESDVDLLIIAAKKSEAEKAIARQRLAFRLAPIIKTPQELLNLRRADPALYENAAIKGIVLFEAVSHGRI